MPSASTIGGALVQPQQQQPPHRWDAGDAARLRRCRAAIDAPALGWRTEARSWHHARVRQFAV